MHPIIRMPAPQNLRSQTVTTCQGCGCDVMHEASRELTGTSASRPIEWNADFPG